MLSVELSKWRGRRILLISGLLTVALLAWAGLATVKLQLAPTTPAAGKVAASTVQTGTQLTSLLLPVLVAIIASRVASIEHEDGMVQLLRSLGRSPRQIATTKAFLVWGLVTGALAVFWGVLCAIGAAFGAAPGPGQLLPVLVAVVVAAAALSAVHLALGMAFENQWITLSVGIVGGLLGSASLLMSPVMAALTPWTLIGGASPVRLAMVEGHAQYGQVSPMLPLLVGVVVAPLWCAASVALVTWKGENE